jgi:hypothetical protein
VEEGGVAKVLTRASSLQFFQKSRSQLKITGTRKVMRNKNCKCKSKAIPLEAWRGPEGSRRLRLPDFKTIGT